MTAQRPSRRLKPVTTCPKTPAAGSPLLYVVHVVSGDVVGRVASFEPCIKLLGGYSVLENEIAENIDSIHLVVPSVSDGILNDGKSMIAVRGARDRLCPLDPAAVYSVTNQRSDPKSALRVAAAIHCRAAVKSIEKKE